MNFVEVLKALADETRIRILNLLMIREHCVCELETILNISQSNASRHLNKLKNMQIVRYEKKAQWIYYQINSSFVEENKALYDYLKQQVKQNSQCLVDIERLNNYVAKGFTCSQLRADKEKINKLLEVES